MNVKNYFTMVCVALAFFACNNEDVPGKGPVDGSEPGEPTYAYFSMKINSGTTTKAASEDPGTADEQAVVDAVVILCKDLTADKSVEDVIYVPAADLTKTGSGYPAPKSPILTTAGAKKIYTVLNPTTETKDVLMALKGTGKTQVDVEKLTVDLGTPDRLGNEHTVPPTPNTTGTWDMDDLTNLPAVSDQRTLMSGSSAVILQPSVPSDLAQQPGSLNNISIGVDRAVGKVEVNFKAGAKVVKDDSNNTVLTLSNPLFSVKNMPNSQYIVQNLSSQNYVVTPNFSAPVNEFENIYNNGISPDKTVGDTEGATAVPVYVPENTTETALIGNATYALVKTDFSLAANKVITGYTAGENNIKGGSFAYNGVADDEGKIMYNFTEGTFYKAVGDDGTTFDATKAVYRWAAYMISQSNNYVDGNITDTPTNAGVTDPSNAHRIDKIYESSQELIEAIGTGTQKLYGYAIVIDRSDGINHVKNRVQVYRFDTGADVTLNSPDDLDNYEFGREEEMAFYKNNSCYYRVNIVDNNYAESSPMHFAIIRNYWYKVAISKVTSIGYPHEDDVNIKPEDPLAANTYVQADVTINPWKVLEDDYEMGL